MTHKEAVREYLASEILHAQREAVVFRDSDSLVKSGLLNSLSIVELMSYLEQKFGIDIGDQEIEIDDFDSVDRICHLLERKGVKS